MIARKRNLVTDLGKLLDPIADKCLVMASLLLVIAYPIDAKGAILSSDPNFAGIIGIIGIIIILAREIIVSALRMIAASKSIVLKADKLGKIKTILQDITLAGYIFYAFLVTEFTLSKTLNAVFGISLLVLFIVSVIFTIISGVNYLVKNKNIFSENEKK